MCACIHNHLYKSGTWLEREQVVFKRMSSSSQSEGWAGDHLPLPCGEKLAHQVAKKAFGIWGVGS